MKSLRWNHVLKAERFSVHSMAVPSLSIAVVDILLYAGLQSGLVAIKPYMLVS